jgi:hypothetical protein
MSHALSLEHLEPVGAGIAASRELWEPLLDAARLRPVELIATEAYDVWLVAHPCVPRTVRHQRGAAHLITPVHGDLAVSTAGDAVPHRIVDQGRTVAAPDDRDLELAGFGEPVTYAIHVHSPATRVTAPSATDSAAADQPITTTPVPV